MTVALLTKSSRAKNAFPPCSVGNLFMLTILHHIAVEWMIPRQARTYQYIYEKTRTSIFGHSNVAATTSGSARTLAGIYLTSVIQRKLTGYVSDTEP